MDNYIVSARKYRPSTFESVVGQKSLTQTLKNAIANNKLAHAYLFCGPRGVGKTSCARIFAKTINCLTPTASGDACNSCESCTAFNEQRSYNIHELDAASNNKVDDIRYLIEQVMIPPQIGRYKVYIIDEVHMLSAAAFNAFLKTLEEPPHHAIFVLATTEKHKILPTILSRCQTYDFSRITAQDTVEHLLYVAKSENINAEPQALAVIAQKADGGMRDALSIFDQVASFTGGNITYKAVIDNLNVLDYEFYFNITDAFLQNNVQNVLLILDDIIKRGFDPQHFITGLTAHFRDLLVSKDPVTISLIEGGKELAQRYHLQASGCDNQFIYKALEISNECDYKYSLSKNKRLLVEIALIRISQITAPQPPQNTQGGNEGMQKISNPQQAVHTQSQNASQAYAQQQAHAAPAAAQPQQAPTAQPATERTVAHINPSATAQQIPMPQNQHTGKQGAKPIKSFSIKKPAAQTQSEVQSTESNMQEIVTPVDNMQLNKAWKEFIETIPTETILVQTMHSSPPKLIEGSGDYRFEVIVDNIDQIERINGKAGYIINFLRSKLRNTKLSMVLKERTKAEQKKGLSAVDRLKLMHDANEDLKRFMNTFDLEIA